jgi:glycerate kinase
VRLSAAAFLSPSKGPPMPASNLRTVHARRLWADCGPKKLATSLNRDRLQHRALTLDFGLWTLDSNKPVSLNVLIAPDKFKGTLSAGAAAAAIARGWGRTRPRDCLTLLPITDGGDGFGEVVGRLLGAGSETVRTVNAAGHRRRARWWLEPQSKTAVIESASVIGLAMLPPGRFHPFQLDTFGLGAVFDAAVANGARRCLVGIGGSATNDGGFGLARALGWQFLDRSGHSIDHWTGLGQLAKIRQPKPRPWFKELLVAVDVQNRLLGPRGATRVYGPQKGLRPRDFPLAERCLRRLAKLLKQELGRDYSVDAGAGAAGGLGFGLLAFADATLEPGFGLFARLAGLERRLASADLVITGEGGLDDSTFMGKGVGQIARQCRRLGIGCLGLAGVLSISAPKRRLFTRTLALTEVTSLEQAKAEPGRWLAELAAAAAQRLNTPNPPDA